MESLRRAQRSQSDTIPCNLVYYDFIVSRIKYSSHFDHHGNRLTESYDCSTYDSNNIFSTTNKFISYSRKADPILYVLSNGNLKLGIPVTKVVTSLSYKKPCLI
jgi:hypothetical protein